MKDWRFACIPGCTACCRRPGTLVVTREDIVKLARHLGLSLRKFEKKYLERDHGRYFVRMTGPEKICPFLGGDAQLGWCTVYEARPVQCATYPFWPSIADRDSAWEQERELCPGIGQGPVVPARLVQIQLSAAAAVDRGR